MSQSKPLHFRLCLASPGGFEPLTPRLGGECSIQLSYEDTSFIQMCYNILKELFVFVNLSFNISEEVPSFKHAER